MKKPLSQPLFLRFLQVLRPLGCLHSVSQASVAGTQKTHLPSLHATLLPSPVEAEAETSAPPLRTPRLTPPGSHGVPFFFPALKDTSKRSINSDWKIELPGEYQIAGTTVRYVRRGLWEKISAKGPTKIPLHLMVTCCAFVFVLSLVLQGVCWLSSSLGPGERFPGTWLLVGYLATCCSSLPRPLSLSIFSYLIPFATCLRISPSQNFTLALHWQRELPSFSKGTASRKEILRHVAARENWPHRADSLARSLCFYIRWHRSAPQFVYPHWKLPFGNELLTLFPNQRRSDFPDSACNRSSGIGKENQVLQEDLLPG